MLTSTDISKCRYLCTKILKTSRTKKTAKRRLLKFKYKGVGINSKQCDKIIRVYIEEYGTGVFLSE